MDEFTSSLDHDVRRSYLQIIAEQSAQKNHTIVGVMHDIDGVNLPNLRIIRLLAGRLQILEPKPAH